MYPTDEETFDERVSPEFMRDDHLNDIQALLKRLQDFLGYGGRLHDKFGLVLPAGSWVGFGGLTAPDGWLLCNGKPYDYTDSDYSDLYAVIGAKYGSPWVDYFNVPDFRGYFIRGYSKIPSVNFVPADVDVGTNRIALTGQEFYRSKFPVRFTTADTLPAPLAINTTYYLEFVSSLTPQSVSVRADRDAGGVIDITTQGVGTHTIHPYVEEDKDDRLRLSTNANVGEELGTYQEDAFQKHYHKVSDVNPYYPYSHTNMGVGASAVVRPAPSWLVGRYNAKDVYTDGSFPAPRETIETRPRNVNVNYIIKR